MPGAAEVPTQSFFGLLSLFPGSEDTQWGGNERALSGGVRRGEDVARAPSESSPVRRASLSRFFSLRRPGGIWAEGGNGVRGRPPGEIPPGKKPSCLLSFLWLATG
jgi:hypothetical protein